MRGWHFLGPGIAGGLAGNYWCHRKDRPTVSSDTRRVPAVVAGLAWGALSGWLMAHLYGPRHRPRR